MRRFFTRFLIPVLIIAGGVAGAREMILSTETVAPTPKPAPAPEVEVATLVASQRPAVISGTGVVEAARQLTVVPEVGGRIVYQSPALTVGGRVAAGDMLVRIDRSAYTLALRQQRSQVEQAELERELESGRGELARREWGMIQKGAANPAGPGRLASRQAQGEAAEVGVDAAKSALERAALDLRRTVIRAPFDATVTRENVEVGQVVTPSATLATLVGTAEAWVRVALPVDALRLLEVPAGKDERGSPATVSQQLAAGDTASWNGEVLRLVHELDPDSRMLQVLVSVKDPFEVGEGQLPLLPSAFVTVKITSEGLAPTLAIPRKALFEGRRVWTVTSDDTLQSRELVIRWGDADYVYVDVTAEVPDGTRIVLEPPPSAVEAMVVKPKPSTSSDAPVSAAAAPTAVDAAQRKRAGPDGASATGVTGRAEG